jgi:hypothetical protein
MALLWSKQALVSKRKGSSSPGLRGRKIWQVNRVDGNVTCRGNKQTECPILHAPTPTFSHHAIFYVQPVPFSIRKNEADIVAHAGSP